MKINTVILLTACINPSGMSFTVLQDPQTRLKQYLSAVKYYLKVTDLPIVFCENTNFDISEYFTKEIESKRLEVLTFEGNNFNKSLGKGYGESLIIEYALNNSVLIKQSDRLIKITGRIKVNNIVRLLNYSNKPNCVYANIVKTNLGISVCDSICFISPKSFLEKYFLIEKDRLNDSKGFYFEHLLIEKCISWKSHNNNEWEEFKLPIFMTGQSGSTGIEYIIRCRWLTYLRKFIRYMINRRIIMKL